MTRPTNDAGANEVSRRASMAANLLVDQHRKRLPFAALPQDCAPRNDLEAYATQSALQQLREAELGKTAGYKVALTSTVMQEMLQYFSQIQRKGKKRRRCDQYGQQQVRTKGNSHQ